MTYISIVHMLDITNVDQILYNFGKTWEILA